MSRTRLVLPALLSALALAAAGCGSSSSSTSDAKASASGSAPGSPSADAAGGTCSYLDDTSGGPIARKVSKPPAEPTSTGSVPFSISTNFGDMTGTLDAKKAPCAVNSFVSLIKQGYYDKTDCVRVTNSSQGFHVLQCGDPSGTQAGTPGYRFAQEVDGSETYQPGAIAMANTGQPESTGGQFFIVYDKTGLAPDYTVVGTLSAAGLKVAQKASAAATKGAPDGYDGKPVTPVTFTKVTTG